VIGIFFGAVAGARCLQLWAIEKCKARDRHMAQGVGAAPQAPVKAKDVGKVLADLEG
jgi:hypothetical protein